MEVVFGSILFDVKDEIANDFFESLSKQDTDNFHIVLINDNLKAEKLNRVLSKYPNLNSRTEILNVYGKLTRYENRQKLIYECKRRNYDLLVRGDFDDTFQTDKISSYIKQFDNEYGFFYNDILIDDISIFASIPNECLSYKDLGQYNFVGEGACALNLNKISDKLIETLKKGKTNVFDWYLFSRLLLAGLKGKFVDGAATYYRIYDNNTAGTPEITEKTLSRELEIKKLHYSLLQDENIYFKNLLEKYNNPNNIKINKLEKYFWWQFTKVEE